jgi:hypothetical protein
LFVAFVSLVARARPQPPTPNPKEVRREG